MNCGVGMKWRTRAAIGLAAAFAILLIGAAAADARQLPKVAPAEKWAAAELDQEGDIPVVIIQREGATAERAAGRLSRKSMGRVRRSFQRIAGDVIKVAPERLAEVLADLEADPDVLAAAPDRRDRHIQGQVLPWGVARIEADPANRAALGLGSAAGVKIAVLDTGIWRSPSTGAIHPDLAAAYRGGWDFINDDPNPWDDNGHGTHVAGIIAATDNGTGVVGVAPGVSLYALKVFDAYGSGYYSDFIAALDWCIEHDVRIVNYSAGGPDPWSPEEAACERARAAGITIVASAGNDAGAPVQYPAAYPSVIAVGATTSKELLWVDTDDPGIGSSTGGELDLVAPGKDIRSTFLDGRYLVLTGTSMAAPHVAGAAALLAGRRVSDPRLVQEYLQDTAADLGDPGFDTQHGHGRVNAGALLPELPENIAPATGDVVLSGRYTAVSWDEVPGASTYRVLFARSGSADWSEIAAAISAASTVWRAPVVGNPLTTGRLQVAAYDGGGRLLSVATRTGFSVRSLRFTAPAAGAAVAGGSRVRLTWEVYATPRPVSRIAVELSEDGGKTWVRRAKLSAAARSYGWDAPAVSVEGQVRLRVILLDVTGRAIATAALPLVVVPAAAP